MCYRAFGTPFAIAFVNTVCVPPSPSLDDAGPLSFLSDLKRVYFFLGVDSAALPGEGVCTKPSPERDCSSGKATETGMKKEAEKRTISPTAGESSLPPVPVATFHEPDKAAALVVSATHEFISNEVWSTHLSRVAARIARVETIRQNCDGPSWCNE